MANRLVASAVQRCVNDFQTALCAQIRIQALFQHILVISIDYRLRCVGDHAVSHGCFEIGMLDILENIQCIDLSQNCICGVNGHLTAIAAVYFITVVLCRVVAGGYHNTCAALLRTYCIGEHRSRHQLCIDVYLDAVCSQHFRSSLCKYIGLDAAVIRNGNAGVCECRVHIVGQTLCCTANRINVHTVCASTNDTTETAGTEFQITVKAVTDRCIISGNCLQFCLQISVICCTFKPLLI